MDALLTSGVCVWSTLCTHPSPSACACVCESGSVTSVRTRSWLLWRWRRGRQRRNMTHGKLSRSSESGSRVWPQLWKRVCSPRWKPPCISARSFARLARPPAAHPGQPAAPLASWPRMRVYVCYNNVAKELAAYAWHFKMGKKTPPWFSAILSMMIVYGMNLFAKSDYPCDDKSHQRVRAVPLLLVFSRPDS